MNKKLIRTEEVPGRERRDIRLQEDETFEIVGGTVGHKNRVIVTPVRVESGESFHKCHNFNNKNTSPIFVDIYKLDSLDGDVTKVDLN